MSVLGSYLREKNINLTNWILSLLVKMMEIYGSVVAQGLNRFPVLANISFINTPAKMFHSPIVTAIVPNEIKSASVSFFFFFYVQFISKTNIPIRY